MLIRCTRAFRDLKAAGKPLRAVGEEWEADASRLDEINRAGYGVMAEAVEAHEEAVETPAGAAETAPAARKAATPKKGAATRRTARKSAQEG